ncbi:MAG: RNA polymerase sigma factor [Rhizobiaceae bacterium]
MLHNSSRPGKDLGNAKPGTDAPPPDQSAELWRASLAGDEDAFELLVAPCLADLSTAAQRDLRYHAALGDLREADLTPEELVGETLLRAWRDRRRRPATLALKPWLLGLQVRVLNRIVRKEQEQRHLASVSLESPALSEPIYDDGEAFWEWYQPDEATRWEDVLPTETTSREEVIENLLEQAVPNLSPIARQVFVLRHINCLSAAEIASCLHTSQDRVRALWKEAVTSVLEVIEA